MPTTISEKVTLVPKLSFVVTKALLALLGSPFRGNSAAPTVGEHVQITAFRTLFTHFTTGQIQAILPPFTSEYEKWSAKQKLKPNIVDIPNTTVKGFWMGDPSSAKYALVYYHGGGFVMTGLPQHLDMLFRFIKWSDGNLAVFCVAYTLAPEALYPVQIGESVEGLRYVLSLPGRKPETTLLGGDSAGGNLVLAVLSHISGHPHPNTEIVKPLQLTPTGQKLLGALAIAPWVSSEGLPRFKSVKQFHGRDVVSFDIANYWIATYKGKDRKQDDEYVVPELAAANWWSGTKETVSSVLALAGAEEVLIDAIRSWAGKFEEGTRGAGIFKLVVGKREIHDQPLTPKSEAELDRLGDDSQEGAIKSWIKAHCRT